MCMDCYLKFNNKEINESVNDLLKVNNDDLKKLNSTSLSFIYLFMADKNIDEHTKQCIYNVFEKIANNGNILYSIKKNSMEPQSVDRIVREIKTNFEKQYGCNTFFNFYFIKKIIMYIFVVLIILYFLI